MSLVEMAGFLAEVGSPLEQQKEDLKYLSEDIRDYLKKIDSSPPKRKLFNRTKSINRNFFLPIYLFIHPHLGWTTVIGHFLCSYNKIQTKNKL